MQILEAPSAIRKHFGCKLQPSMEDFSLLSFKRLNSYSLGYRCQLIWVKHRLSHKICLGQTLFISKAVEK